MYFWRESMVNARELVGSLRQGVLRCRTGVLSLATPFFGTEAQIAAVLGVEYLDYRVRLQTLIPPDSSFVHLDLPRLIGDVDAIANSNTGETCVLVANFDLALARLATDDVRSLWRVLLTDFPHKTRALLFCVPSHAGASFCIPDTSLYSLWRESDRFAEWVQV